MDYRIRMRGDVLAAIGLSLVAAGFLVFQCLNGTLGCFGAQARAEVQAAPAPDPLVQSAHRAPAYGAAGETQIEERFGSLAELRPGEYVIVVIQSEPARPAQPEPEPAALVPVRHRLVEQERPSQAVHKEAPNTPPECRMTRTGGAEFNPCELLDKESAGYAPKSNPTRRASITSQASVKAPRGEGETRRPDPSERTNIGSPPSRTTPNDLASAIAEGWYDELLIEIRAGRVARKTVHALMGEGEVLVPARALLNLLEIRVISNQESELRAELQPDQVEIRIDSEAERAWIGPQELDRDKVILRRTPEELYLGRPLIGELLGVQTWFDFGEMTLQLDPVQHLPLGRRVARERARAALLAHEVREPPEVAFGSSLGGLNGATVDWAVVTPNYKVLSNSRYKLALGTSVLGGSLNLRYRGSETSRLDHLKSELEGSWIGAWPESRWIRQLGLGWVSGTGPRPRSLRGVAISSSPFMRPSTFGQTTLTGHLEPNWEVELYRNGELTDFARVDPAGYFELDTPIDYGQNPVEVRAYGPNGEMRLLSRAIPVSADQVPAGALEYAASVGECSSGYRNCNLIGNMDLRYGLNRSWTVRAGTEAFGRDEAGDLVHPYAVLSGTYRRSWALRAEGVANAFGGLQISHEPSPDVRTRLSHTVFATGIEAPILSPAGVLNRSTGSLFWRPWPSLRRWFLTLDATRTQQREYWQASGIMQVTGWMGGMRWSAQWRESLSEHPSWTTRSTVLGFGSSTVLHYSKKSFLNGVFVRGAISAEIRRGTLDRASLSLGKSVSRTARFEVGSMWLGGSRTPRLSISLTFNGSAFRSFNRVARSQEGKFESYASLDGSLVWNDAVGRLEPFPHHSTGWGGLSGTAFVDSNGNGWRDPGEEPVPRLRLRAGDKVAETDPQGRYSLWNLTPFEATDLELIPSSLRDPLLVPQFRLASVKVLPNGFREINLPMVPGTEVLGRILTDGRADHLEFGGLHVTLRNLATGKAEDAATFRDGGFYFMTLAPGEYEVILNPDDLQRLDLVIDKSSRYCRIPTAGNSGEAFELVVKLVPHKF